MFLTISTLIWILVNDSINKHKWNQTVNGSSHQVSKLHWEAAVWVVLNVHNFSVVGQDEKLTTSEEKKEGITEEPHGFVKLNQNLCWLFLGATNATVAAEIWTWIHSAEYFIFRNENDDSLQCFVLQWMQKIAGDFKYFERHWGKNKPKERKMYSNVYVIGSKRNFPLKRSTYFYTCF